MNAIFVLLILFFLSAFPLLISFPFILKKRRNFGLRSFFLAVVLGLGAVIPAAIAQVTFNLEPTGLASLLTRAFLLTAGIEETSKLIILRLFRKKLGPPSEAATAGIAASLGFAFFETVVYASANPLIALLRAATAAPVHAACGAWIGKAANSPTFLSGVTMANVFAAFSVHGAYDLTLFVPKFPIVVPILIALACLATIIHQLASTEEPK